MLKRDRPTLREGKLDMCLQTVDRQTFKGNGVGYKLFEPEPFTDKVNFYYKTASGIDNVEIMFGGQKPGDTMPVGVWIRDKKICHIPTIDASYKCGFHIYHSKESLERYGEKKKYHYKVYYRNVVASGYESSHRVIVAKEIFICPKEWLDEED